MLVLQDELAARSSDAAEQPDTASQPNALQEEAAVAVRPDPEQDAADSEYPVLAVLGLFELKQRQHCLHAVCTCFQLMQAVAVTINQTMCKLSTS